MAAHVRVAMQRDAASRAAGARLLQKLPWRQRMEARLRSAALLLVVATVFWPTLWTVACICAAHHALRWAGAHLKAWHQQQDEQRRRARRAKQGAPQQQQQQQVCVAAQPALDGCSMLAPDSSATTTRGTALVTGGKMTKALHVCRHLHVAGWRVVLVETGRYWAAGARASASVDVFRIVPKPEAQPDAYVDALAGIAKAEGVSLFIPVSSPIASLYDALAAEAMPQGCRCWCLSPSMTALLDDKASFSQYAASLGLRLPVHHRVTSQEQLAALNSAQALGGGGSFVLKSLAYDSVHRADLFRLPCRPEDLRRYASRPDVDISPQQPWILQQWIQGKEFSCYVLADAGHVVAYADTAAELSNLNYSFTGHPGIRQWVDQFVSGSGATGQLCFDFIESARDGALYCIECNPRTSSVITEFYDHPSLVQAFIDPASVRRTVLPLPASRPTYWFFNEAARLLLRSGYLWGFLLVVSHGRDAVFDVDDPLPFLGLHFLQVPVLLLGNILHGKPWRSVDLCIGKIAELYGD